MTLLFGAALWFRSCLVHASLVLEPLFLQSVSELIFGLLPDLPPHVAHEF